MFSRPDVSSRVPGSGPTTMSNQQMGDYLYSLRSNPVARPQGSRPLPSSSISRTQALATDKPVGAHRARSSLPGTRPHVDYSYSRSSSLQSTNSSRNSIHATSTSQRQASQYSYVEREQRQAEKKEARDLRLALEDVNLEDERRMHEAASEEAAELIWRHKHPGAPYRLKSESRNVDGPNDRCDACGPSAELPQSIERDFAVDRCFEDVAHKDPHSRRISFKPLPTFSSPTPINQLADKKRMSNSRRTSGSMSNKAAFPNEEEKIYEDPIDRPLPALRMQPTIKDDSVPAHVRRNPFARARESRSGQFPNRPFLSSRRPQLDKSAETETAQTTSITTQLKDDTPVQRDDVSTVEQSESMEEKVDEEVRYRDGIEVRSDELRAATSMSLRNRSSKLPSPAIVSDNPERPIVSFKPDWTPSANELQSSGGAARSDQMKRPGTSPRVQENSHRISDPVKSNSSPMILSTKGSNQHDCQSSNSNTGSGQYSQIPAIDITPLANVNPSSQRHVSNIPSIQVDKSSTAASSIPTINVDGPPSIVVDTIPDPVKSRTQSLDSLGGRNRGTRSSESAQGRPMPRHAATAPSRSQFHMTPSVRRQTALCAQCALPISGKIVSAAGARFHPECFTCFHCNEALECVAFYTEPTERRVERLNRAERRRNGETLEEEDGTHGEQSDGDDSLRFYCHLDYHELFSPRCRSCKTPIEGEVIVACGAEWHVGHFFCASCGDPFDPSTPFVEKDGYAWCINCHTNRTSSRCKKCKKPVVDMVVKAMDAEWHEECFRCTDCDGKFDDGRYFVKGKSQEPVCFACGEMRLKA